MTALTVALDEGLSIMNGKLCFIRSEEGVQLKKKPQAEREVRENSNSNGQVQRRTADGRGFF